MLSRNYGLISAILAYKSLAESKEGCAMETVCTDVGNGQVAVGFRPKSELKDCKSDKV